jgi:Protein of unknown function (DUF4056)
MKTLLLLLLIPLTFYAKSPELSDAQLISPPTKIIRTCCSFGEGLKLVFFPFIEFTDITAAQSLGKHKYLGSDTEQNGIIYTQKGGFIDIAHLRDLSDWTGFLYNTIKKSQANGNLNFKLKLGYEGGNKELILQLPKNLSDENAVLLAGKIAYDLSVWHEIATWYGNSYIPLIPERYSAFSVEDPYSNLMGVLVGMEAIRSDLPYEDAVTAILFQKLKDLEAVESFEATAEAMNSVKEIWWTDKSYLPSGKVLLKREFKVYGDSLLPRLLPNSLSKPTPIAIPLYSTDGVELNDFYSIEIKLNRRFPYKQIYGKTILASSKNEKRVITQRNFEELIANGTKENHKRYPIEEYRFD